MSTNRWERSLNRSTVNPLLPPICVLYCLYSVVNHPSQKNNTPTHQYCQVTLPRWALFALWKCCLCTGSGVQRVILPRFPTLLPHESLNWRSGQASLPFFPNSFSCLWGLNKKPIGYLLLPISTQYRYQFLVYKTYYNS